MTKKINLTDDSIYSLFIKIAIPSSIGTIFQNLYTVVDSIFAGNMISESALAAIGQIFPIYFIIIALGVGLSIGTTSLIANSIGEKNYENSGKIFTQSFILSIFISLAVTIIGIYFSSFLIKSLNNDKETEINIAIIWHMRYAKTPTTISAIKVRHPFSNFIKIISLLLLRVFKLFTY